METEEHEGTKVKKHYTMPGYDGIIKSFFQRETRGKQLQLANPFGREGYPKRMKMSVEQVIPQSALEAGHVFMGFTNCNRYLLSYTVRPTDNFGIVLEEPAFFYHLHFWLFMPYKPAKKMATVVIFDNNGVTDNNLLIEMSQWRQDDDRILVTGQCYRTWIGDHDPAHTQVYATIATVPKPCKDCNYFPDEDFEEENPSCTLNPCLKHGLTINLNFDHVLPFPRFDADIQLRYKSGVVFNTGNVLHVFTFKTLEPAPFIPRAELPVVVSTQTMTPAASILYLFCDFWLKKCSHSIDGILEKGPIREDTQYYANNADSKPDALKNEDKTENAMPASNTNDSQENADNRIAIKASPMKPRLMLPPQERKFFKQRKSQSELGSPVKRSSCVTTSTASMLDEDRKLSPVKSENAYDISDIGSEEHLERFSSFRKRRLADKKYEFSDSEPLSENIASLKLNRKEVKPDVIATVTFNQLGSPRSSPRYERAGSESPRHAYCLDGYPRSPRGPLAPSPLMSPNSDRDQEVLRPISNTLNSSILKLLSNATAGETDSIDKTVDTETANDATDFVKPLAKKPSRDAAFIRDQKIRNGADVSPLVPAKDDRPTISASINCTAKILRSYIHREDDDISVITDIEDDCNFANQFFAALPLDVHGESYHQLQMISNAKAEKSPLPVVQVLQRTLDIELLCNEVAGIICHSEEMTCFSCIDWDPAVIDVCPNKCTVTAVVFVLVEAVSKSPSPFHKPQTRYETMFTFAWDPDMDYCRILGKGRLKEVRRSSDPWQPTKTILSKVKTFNDHLGLRKGFKVLVNDLMVSDFTTVTELEDASGMVGIFLENSPDKRRLAAFDDDSSTDGDDSSEDSAV